MSGQPSSSLMIWPGFQPGRRHHADLAGAERQVVVGVVAVGRGGVGLVEDLLEVLEPGDRLGRVELADPLAVLLGGDVAAVLPDERHHRVPVLAGQVDAREVRDVGVVGLQLATPAATISSSVVGISMPDLLEEVLAVDHDAGAGVVRHGVELAVVRPGLEPGSAGSRRRRGRRPCRSGRRPRRRPRSVWAWVLPNSTMSGASLPDSDVVSRSTMPGPLLALELDLDVRVDLVELGDGVLDDLVGRVGAVEPQADGAALTGALTDRDGRGLGPAGRGRTVVSAASVPAAPSVPPAPRCRSGRRCRCARRRRRRRRRRAGRGGQHRQHPHGSCSVHGRSPRLNGAVVVVMWRSGRLGRPGCVTPCPAGSDRVGARRSSDAELVVEDPGGRADEHVVEAERAGPHDEAVGEHGHRAGARWPRTAAARNVSVVTGPDPDSTTSATSSALSTVARATPRCSPARVEDRPCRRRPSASSRRSSSGSETSVSRQPRLPHAHRAPSGTTTTWPISPAAYDEPVNRRPSSTSPAPTPSSTRTQIRLPAGSLAERQLGEGRGVGVVDDGDREVELARQVGASGSVGPAEVGGGDDDAVGVDDARAGDADAEQRPLGVGDELAADPRARASPRPGRSCPCGRRCGGRRPCRRG